jgi:hypothetical protein
MPTATAARDSTGRIPTIPFRFDATTLASIDLIADYLTATTGSPSTRAAAVRFAVRQAAVGIRDGKKLENNS